MPRSWTSASPKSKKPSSPPRASSRARRVIPRAGHYDETGEFPREIFKKAFETGLMNVEIPEAYGGLGGSCLDNCLVQEEVSFGCSGINTSMAANSLGATPLLVAGTRRAAEEVAVAADQRADVLRLLLQRARRRQRRRRHAHARHQARRRLRAQRPEALDHQRRRRQLLHGVRDVRSGDEAQGHRVLRRRREHAGRQGRAARRTRWASAPRTRRDVIFEDVKIHKSQLLGSRGRWLQGRDEDVRPVAPVDRGDRGRRDPALRSRRAAPTRSSARRSACRSRSTRRCSSCSPRWRSPTRRRACSRTRRRGWSTRATCRASCRATRRPTAPTRRCAARPTRCRSSAATATRRSTRSRS